MAWVAQGKYDEALAHFQNAIIADPLYSQAYNNMGNIYSKRQDKFRAFYEWERAIIANPNNSRPYYNIGLGFKKKGDYARALLYFEKYMALDKEPDPRAIYHIEKLHELLKRQR
jgi:tetratricopeptide (TPR) repeat protein